MALISSVNSDGTPNLAPISSFWALGWTMTLGLLEDTKTLENLRNCPDCVVNLPSPDMWRQVEALAPLTGKNPVPEDKKKFRHEHDKFQAGNFTRIPSETVPAPRVKECPVHMEAVVRKIHQLEVMSDSGSWEADPRWKSRFRRSHSPRLCFEEQLHRSQQVAASALQLPALFRARRRTWDYFPG